MAGRPAWIVTVMNPEKLPAESHKIGHGHVIDGAVKSALIIKMSKHGLVHRLISGRHTAVGDLADFQGAERRAY